jgi:hypothetical protein
MSATPQARPRGASIMQPLARAAPGAGAAGGAEPGTSAFAALAAADIRPDAVFFHKFYSAKAALRATQLWYAKAMSWQHFRHRCRSFSGEHTTTAVLAPDSCPPWCLLSLTVQCSIVQHRLEAVGRR